MINVLVGKSFECCLGDGQQKSKIMTATHNMTCFFHLERTSLDVLVKNLPFHLNHEDFLGQFVSADQLQNSPTSTPRHQVLQKLPGRLCKDHPFSYGLWCELCPGRPGFFGGEWLGRAFPGLAGWPNEFGKMVFHDGWKAAPVSLTTSAVGLTKWVVSASVGSNGFQRMRRDQLEFAGASNWPLAPTN